MEIALIIIIGYILSVFLNRWLNYIIFKKYNYKKCVPFWFFSIMGALALLIIIIDEYLKTSNWFTGRDWDKK